MATLAIPTSLKTVEAPKFSYNKPLIIGSIVATGLALYGLWSWKNQSPKNIPNKKWLSSIPKIELHAHLHGSIRMSTLAELYENASKDPNLKHIIKQNENPKDKIRSILKKHKTFNEVFALFDVIHRVVNSKIILIRIINEVLLDFAKQNVKYLELRSTPRKLEYSNHSRSDYVSIILNEIARFPIKYPQYNDMIIRFIITIQNAKPLNESYESLNIIQKYSNNLGFNDINYIVGIDFAPRPIKDKQFKYFQNILSRARNMGLKITIHFAEFYDRKEQDLILNFSPDRLGHAVNLGENDYKYLLNNCIPIEMCPTSNIYTKSIKTYNDHPFKILRNKYKNIYGNTGNSEYPMLFCTDDCGVFETDLINEWMNMVNAHQLTKYDVKNIIRNSIDFIFANDEIKNKLKLVFNNDNLWA